MLCGKYPHSADKLLGVFIHPLAASVGKRAEVAIIAFSDAERDMQIYA
jgi:hypothetical protein